MASDEEDRDALPSGVHLLAPSHDVGQTHSPWLFGLLDHPDHRVEEQRLRFLMFDERRETW